MIIFHGFLLYTILTHWYLTSTLKPLNFRRRPRGARRIAAGHVHLLGSLWPGACHLGKMLGNLSWFPWKFMYVYIYTIIAIIYSHEIYIYIALYIYVINGGTPKYIAGWFMENSRNG